MKASLRIRNVGGLRGERGYDFERGRVNLLESSNSSGKSSVIRGLLAALSLSPSEELSDRSYLNESISLGIHVDPRNTGEGFVNVHSDEAQVFLTHGNETRALTFRKDGRITEDKGSANPKFIYAGILSNNSRILRQLRGATDSEPDDFEWAVSEMSLAKWYTNISAFAETKQEDLDGSLKSLESVIRRSSELEEGVKKMASQIKKIDTEIERLNIVLNKGGSKYKGDFNKKRNDLIGAIDELKTKKAKVEASIKDKQEEAKKIQDRIRKLEEQKKGLTEEYGKIDLKTEEENVKEEKEALETNTEKLKEKKAGVESILNLLVYAEEGIAEDSAETACPLCENGKLTVSSLKKRLLTLRSERAGITKEMLSLAEKKRNLAQAFEEKKAKTEEMKKKIENIGTDISNQKRVLEDRGYTGGLAREVEDYSKKIEGKEAELSKLYALISSDDLENFEKCQNLEKEREKINNEMIADQREIERSNVTHYGRIMPAKDALAVVKRQIELLGSIIKEMNRRAEAQKEEAKKLFNASVKDLLDKLKFEEFRSVALNKEYRLYVERFDEKRRDYVKQNASTLSTSEKLAIALILQVALKETYVPDVPFLLVDDVLEDLDKGRLDIVLKYLSLKARESDWYVVATKLVEGEIEPRVAILKG